MEVVTRRLLAIPLQGWTGRKGSRSLRIPEFLDNWHMKVVRLSALRTGRLYPSGDILGNLSVRVDPKAVVLPERLRQWPHRESNLRLSKRWIPEDSNLRPRVCSLITVKQEVWCECVGICILRCVQKLWAYWHFHHLRPGLGGTERAAVTILLTQTRNYPADTAIMLQILTRCYVLCKRPRWPEFGADLIPGMFGFGITEFVGSCRTLFWLTPLVHSAASSHSCGKYELLLVISDVLKCRGDIFCNSKVQPIRRNFYWFIYFYRRSSCFRRFLHPSSGARNCIYSFR
jgi:hypothetical protein